MNLSKLETELAAAKAARDNDRIRSLLPEINKARAIFREFAEAYEAQQNRKGLDLKGNKVNPDSRLLGAIFGAEPASKMALSKLQDLWSEGKVALDPPEPEEEPVSYAPASFDPEGQFEVSIWASKEAFYFNSWEAALEYKNSLPVHAEVRDLEEKKEPMLFFAT